ncbi:aminodeoxychorismate lyase [Tsukamurella ocularis]|uniref:aminodeoxychorismate lyase n=1 Tax=Tsukamurella ocularis TaxID=1970234 RepID=UPI002168903B|nr:aminodeoxychorismate lyase [Tsukamurella ocularis]MCS3778625.1 4-amino-4-deoxychorismate lyase [Tsukamurella ocularis]MCS3789326.1 4-amino-4-deoxychorismate lyase [Tsukamurella ocularis]MCS3851308.1 4-amino-4-deoxychorismate lyase [Tsukamurella ocularis]
MASVVVTLDGSVRAPDAPLLYADDLGAVRGDGCFETVLVRDGAPLKGRAHLDRLGRSAAALGLPAPNDGAWWAAMQRAAMLYGEEAGSAEGALRLVYTRGRESAPGTPTAYVSVSPLPDRARRARTEGISAITLSRGYSTGLGTDAPWLLLGAKTLSYAVNMAAARYAEEQGADDVIFTSSEGRVLEAPRATVVIARGRTLVTPPAEQGILPGTTARALFDAAEDKGVSTAVEPLFPVDLVMNDGVWLVSSITLCARVHTLDGRALPDAPMDATVRSLIEAGIANTP